MTENPKVLEEMRKQNEVKEYMDKYVIILIHFGEPETEYGLSLLNFFTNFNSKLGVSFEEFEIFFLDYLSQKVQLEKHLKRNDKEIFLLNVALKQDHGFLMAYMKNSDTTKTPYIVNPIFQKENLEENE